MTNVNVEQRWNRAASFLLGLPGLILGLLSVALSFNPGVAPFAIFTAGAGLSLALLAAGLQHLLGTGSNPFNRVAVLLNAAALLLLVLLHPDVLPGLG